MIKLAEFYYYSSPLTSLNLCQLNCTQTSHWGIVVRFQDGTVYTFDADNKKGSGVIGGVLVTYVKKKEPKIKRDEQKLGQYFISPIELIRIAREVDNEMPLYDLFLQNCQEWAKTFLYRISPHLVSNLPWTFKTWFTIIGTLVAILLVLTVTIVVIVKCSKKSNPNNPRYLRPIYPL